MRAHCGLALFRAHVDGEIRRIHDTGTLQLVRRIRIVGPLLADDLVFVHEDRFAVAPLNDIGVFQYDREMPPTVGDRNLRDVRGRALVENRSSLDGRDGIARIVRRLLATELFDPLYESWIDQRVSFAANFTLNQDDAF